jgi:hypothetical protein
MGGQACVVYGAAEFSRDIDLVVLAEPSNFRRLLAAMDALRAECIAVPPALVEYLQRGHAVHFRCRHPAAEGFRVDVMARLRGLPDFETLWRRRTTLPLENDLVAEVLALPDLVLAKNTQRDKDWPMLRRLVEADYLTRRHPTAPAQIEFWLRELRTAALLIESAARWPDRAARLVPVRSLLRWALTGNIRRLDTALLQEERKERQRDKTYWEPLRRELESLRHTA